MKLNSAFFDSKETQNAAYAKILLCKGELVQSHLCKLACYKSAYKQSRVQLMLKYMGWDYKHVLGQALHLTH